METIDLGFKKFEITRQAFIVFIALTISFFAQLVILIFFIKDSNVIQYIIFVIYVAIMIPLFVYANNCFVTGKCVVLSWVVSMIYVAVATINVLVLIGLAMIPDKKIKESLINASAVKRFSSKKSSR